MNPLGKSKPKELLHQTYEIIIAHASKDTVAKVLRLNL